MKEMMQSLEDRVVLVTGATGGLGEKLATDLAAAGAGVLLHGRSPEKAKAIIEKIADTTGNPQLGYYNADFSSLEDVRRMAEDIRADQTRIDVLINNAGIGPGRRGEERKLSWDGYELRFAVNYLAHFLLTHELMPLLRASDSARIVNVASGAQQAIDFDDVMLERGYDGRRAYSQSKLAQVMFTFDLAEELAEAGISVNCLHPATLMPTTMVLETDFFNATVDSVEKGAEAVLHLAASSETSGISGRYFEGKTPARADAQAYDQDARERLRMMSRRFAGYIDR